jgi:hypothetical protein
MKYRNVTRWIKGQLLVQVDYSDRYDINRGFGNIQKGKHIPHTDKITYYLPSMIYKYKVK